MPARTKVQNEREAIRWIEDGKSYAWIVEKYLEKYKIQTTVSMWATFRHRHGLDRQITRDTNLIPWTVRPEHRWKYPLTMLRFEARRREGHELKPDQQTRLDSWKQKLEEKERVVYYDPDTEAGFFLVPREERDTDLIRRPVEASEPGAAGAGNED